MSIVTVVGAQWGDEGKGKVVDWLSDQADVIVRFQGGHNAGHTLVIDGVTYKLSLLPSGIVRKNKISIIGNGVVIDPISLIDEIDSVRAMGVDITSENLYIAENAALILTLHGKADLFAESGRGKKKIGTTGRGIGPAYEDKVARRAVRVCDLTDEEYLKERIYELVDYHNILRHEVEAEEIKAQYTLEQMLKIRDRILPHVRPVWKDLNNFSSAGKKILFEGAQGVLLDVDHGTYPFVTSSNTVASQAFTGSGLGVQAGKILGIVKAYTTRVGSGPFPTEQDNETGYRLGEKGHEFGTVTGRQRRCGWFDATLVKQSCMVSGINSIVLTKLDVLGGFDKIKIGVSYNINGKEYDYLPANAKLQSLAEPNYIEVDGWKEDISGISEYSELPKNAKNYISKIEELVGVKVETISTSPERKATISLADYF